MVWTSGRVRVKGVRNRGIKLPIAGSPWELVVGRPSCLNQLELTREPRWSVPRGMADISRGVRILTCSRAPVNGESRCLPTRPFALASQNVWTLLTEDIRNPLRRYVSPCHEVRTNVLFASTHPCEKMEGHVAPIMRTLEGAYVRLPAGILFVLFGL